MSLFASLGQSDLFSKDFFAPSPLFDLLERGDFTLEELLAEDELLQEVKSKNDQLIQFLASEENVGKLIQYITENPSEGEDELHQFKYPYMSCEVLCCEVPEIMDAIVEHDNGKFLDQLFAILEPDAPINHYLAGYLEKVLEVLFRRKTIKMMAYLNQKGLPLLKLFLKHIDNYSIMQIIQRLLLPHIPFSMETADLEAVPPEDHENCQCNWSFLPETADLLTARMLDANGKNVPYHVSDLLITVVQLSAPDARFLGHLCEGKNLVQLLDAAFMDVPEESSSAADVALASISVLESLISRLCETTNPFEAMQMAMQHHDDGPHEKSASQLAAIQSVSTLLVQHVPKLCNQLQRYVESDPLGSITLQTKESTPRLGQKGLQLVKLVEATIRLGVPELDNALCKTGALRACLDLFFKYQLNSLLHLSVQRIVLMVLEGGQARRQTQRHLLVECKLLERVLNMLSKRKQLQTEQPKLRHPIFGHLIVISQIIVTVRHQESANEPPPLPPRHHAPSDAGSDLRKVEEDPNKAAHFRDIMAETGVQAAWDEFVNGEFTEIMTAQTAHLGSGGGSSLANDFHNHHFDSMGGIGLDLNGIGFQDRADLSALEQGMTDWLPGTPATGLGDADGDLLAVAQGSLTMYHADDHDSAGSDEAIAQPDFHGSDDSSDGNSDDDEAGTPNAESTAALGQTLFFASFDQVPPGDVAPFEPFAAFPSPSESSSAAAAAAPAATEGDAFDAFASFPAAETSETAATATEEGESAAAPASAEGANQEEATAAAATPAGSEDPFSANVDILSVLASEGSDQSTSQ